MFFLIVFQKHIYWVRTQAHEAYPFLSPNKKERARSKTWPCLESKGWNGDFGLSRVVNFFFLKLSPPWMKIQCFAPIVITNYMLPRIRSGLLR